MVKRSKILRFTTVTTFRGRCRFCGAPLAYDDSPYERAAICFACGLAIQQGEMSVRIWRGQQYVGMCDVDKLVEENDFHWVRFEHDHPKPKGLLPMPDDGQWPVPDFVCEEHALSVAVAALNSLLQAETLTELPARSSHQASCSSCTSTSASQLVDSSPTDSSSGVHHQKFSLCGCCETLRQPCTQNRVPCSSSLVGGGCCLEPTEEEPPRECESSSSSSWFPSEAFQSLSAEQIGVLARLSVLPGVDSLVGHLLEIVQFSNDCGQDIGLACGEAREMSQSVHQFGVLQALVGKDFSCANVDLLIHQLESFKQLFHLIGGHDASSPVGGLPPVDPTGEESSQNGCSQAREGSGK